MSSLVPSPGDQNRPLVPNTPPQQFPLDCHHFQMGTIHGQETPFEISERHLATHSCVLGATGTGKSKFLEQLMRYFMAARCGFVLIDPHGDLSEDLLAFAAHRKVSKKDPKIADRIHYLEPSFEQIFTYDPFQFHPPKGSPAQVTGNAYRAWLRAKADRVAEIFQRKQNQSNFEGMPRLQRVLTDVLIAVGTAIDENNRHLPLSDSLVLLDVKHKRHHQVLNMVRPHLDAEILADLDRISTMKNDDQRMRETESTINRLRSLLSPMVKAIFAQQVQSIDFRSIVQNGEILLVNLRETDYFSADQRRALGGLFIHEILSVAQNEPREQRRSFHLIVDEAAEFIADDIQGALGVMRKFGLSICLAAQDLSSFKKGELDLRPKVLSQCGTIICFRQSWPEDLEILSRVLGTGNLSFEMYEQVTDRPDGYDWHVVEERGINSSKGKSWTEGRSTNSSTTYGNSFASHQSKTMGESVTNSQSETLGSSKSATTSNGKIVTRSQGESQSTTIGESHTTSISSTHGTTVGQSSSHTTGAGESTSKGESESAGENTSWKNIPLAKHREEWRETPQLRKAISDQIEWISQTLHGLGIGEAVVKLCDQRQAVLIKTAFVSEKWKDRDKFVAIERMKERCREKPYFTVPDFAPEAAEERLNRFLEAAKSAQSSCPTTKTPTSPDPFLA